MLVLEVHVDVDEDGLDVDAVRPVRVGLAELVGYLLFGVREVVCRLCDFGDERAVAPGTDGGTVEYRDGSESREFRLVCHRDG